ncbi:MAG: 30S ribosomal protein S2 [Deltaproteobacteria bacterium]|nr:30S ribosomal protein S2 [Deltaproteobacteria bacterium]
MVDVSIQSLLEAGVHFGHQVSRWNPKMRPYIFTARNNIHIIDLEQTLPMLARAYQFVVDQVGRGAGVLFVGTKKQAQEVIQTEAQRVGAYYVSHRWLGGMLTNFRTIKQSIDRLKAIYVRRDAGELEKLPKKEALLINRESEKLERSLGGIKDMDQIPGVIFLVDPKKERIALREANRLRVPVVALADTNCDPDGIDYLIPGNDDAIRAIQLIVTHLADAVAEGGVRRQAAIREEVERKAKRGAEGPRTEERKVAGKGRAYVSKPETFVEGEKG